MGGESAAAAGEAEEGGMPRVRRDRRMTMGDDEWGFGEGLGFLGLGFLREAEERSAALRRRRSADIISSLRRMLARRCRSYSFRVLDLGAITDFER